MAITVPASDVAGTQLAATVTALTAQASTAPYNVAGSTWALDIARRLDQAQLELVVHLLGKRIIKPSTVIANEAYGV